VNGAIFFPDNGNSIADLQLIKVDAVIVDDRRTVVHHAIAGHHPSP